MVGALLKGEEDPVVLVNARGDSPFVLACEHAGRRIPKALDSLGLSRSDLIRHIAWDIGAEQVARRMSTLLRAPLVLQRYSRLVYDCNRPPDAIDAMPAVSELTAIPGNQGISVGWADTYVWQLGGQYFVLDGGDGQAPVPPGT